MKKEQTVHILTLIVDNEFGVLTRITAQIRREGWNIKSLSVAECLDPAISRITLALVCFDATLPSVIHRLSRLACVRSAIPCDLEKHVCRELALLGVKTEQPEALAALIAAQGARTLGEQEGYTLIEATGLPEALDAFVEKIQEIAELIIVRTGPVVLD